MVTGAPFGAHALLINNGTRNTNNLAAQQLTNQVLDHYKSDVMDDMHTNGVTKVLSAYGHFTFYLFYCRLSCIDFFNLENIYTQQIGKNLDIPPL